MSAPTPSDPVAGARVGLQTARASLGTPLVLQLVDAVPGPGSRPVLAGALARDAGASELPGTAEELAKQMVVETAKWKKVIDAAGLVPQ